MPRHRVLSWFLLANYRFYMHFGSLCGSLWYFWVIGTVCNLAHCGVYLPQVFATRHRFRNPLQVFIGVLLMDLIVEASIGPKRPENDSMTSPRAHSPHKHRTTEFDEGRLYIHMLLESTRDAFVDGLHSLGVDTRVFSQHNFTLLLIGVLTFFVLQASTHSG